MAKLTKKNIKSLADASGISIVQGQYSSYPTVEQLESFHARACAINRPSEFEIREHALKIARKHKLVKGEAPTLVGEMWAVDAIAEALVEGL